MGKIFPQCDPAVRAKLAKKVWPRGVPGKENLLAKGWPHGRRVIAGPKSGEKVALKHWKAIDPVLFVAWTEPQKDVFLRQFDPKKDGVALADALLERSVTTLEKYAFHWQDAFFLLEHELGPEVMADRVLARLEAMTAKEWMLGDNNPHTRILQAVFCLECFILRSDPKSAAASCDRIRALVKKRGKKSILQQRLAITVNGDGTVKAFGEDYTSIFLYLVTSTKMSKRILGTWSIDPQHVYVFGPSILTEEIVEPMRRDPRWKQLEREVWFGVFDHPAVDALLGKQGSSVAAKRTLTSAQLDREGAKCIRKLVADVKTVRGQKKKEEKIWIAGVRELIELRAAAGHTQPEELIGHILGVDGWGKDRCAFDMLEASDEEINRWFGYIEKAS